MKTHQVIAGSNGERIVTSTTETLRIPASEIRPGDWLLKHHRRGLAKDKLVVAVDNNFGGLLVLFGLAAAPKPFRKDQMVDVERTT